LPTLHITLDEGGDLNFSPNGSKFYTFAVAWTYDPSLLAVALTDLRFRLLKAGDDIPLFHAAEDKQATRDKVVETVTRFENWNFVAIVVEKRKMNPSIREAEQFYPKFAGMALRFVFKGCLEVGTHQVVCCTDTLPVKKKRDAITKMFKESARKDLPKGTRFDIYHHPSASNKWLQTVDYCCWSVQRKWESNDIRTYEQLKSRLLKTELDVFKNGDGTTYY
jgi:hypothetical protein